MRLLVQPDDGVTPLVSAIKRAETDKKRAMGLRIRMALSMAEGTNAPPPAVKEDDLPFASPAVLVKSATSRRPITAPFWVTVPSLDTCTGSVPTTVSGAPCWPRTA